MTGDFDPYHEWLRIPFGLRPPDHYELLGVQRDEQSKTVFDAKMTARATFVRTFELGEHGDDARLLLADLAAAHACLIDRVKRAQYDTWLSRRSLPPPLPAESAAPPPIPAATALPPPLPTSTPPTIAVAARIPTTVGTTSAPATPAPHARRAGWVLPVAIGSVLGLLFLLGVLFGRRHSDVDLSPLVEKREPKKPAVKPSRPTKQKSRRSSTQPAEAEPPAVEPAVTKPPATEPPPAESPATEAPSSPQRSESPNRAPLPIAVWQAPNGRFWSNDVIPPLYGVPEAVKSQVPAAQAEIVKRVEETVAAFANGFDGPNALARQQLRTRVETEQRHLDAELKSRLQRGEIHSWVGRIEFTEQYALVLFGNASQPYFGHPPGYPLAKDGQDVYGSDGPLCVFELIPDPASAETKSAILTLKDGDWVRFSISKDGRQSFRLPTVRIDGGRIQVEQGMIGLSLSVIEKFDVTPAASSKPPAAEPPPAAESPPPASPPKSHVAGPLNAGTADVLALIDPARDAFGGAWTKDATGLHSPAEAAHSIVRLPVAVPADYALTLVVQRPKGWKGIGPELLVGLLSDRSRFHLVLDAAETSGLALIDGRNFNENESTTRGTRISDGVDCTLTCIVRRHRVEALVDGQTVVKWSGEPRQLSPLPNWPAMWPSPLRLVLCTHCNYHFKAIRLTPLADAGYLPDTSTQPPVDLLKTIDLKRHVVRGPWAFEGPVLVAPPNAGHSIVRVPGAIPDEYALRIVAEFPREHQGAHEFAFGLVTKPSQVHVVVDSNGVSGFENVDGRGANANETTHSGQLFVPGVESTIDCLVRKQGIRVDFDGRTIIDWKGDRQRLTSGWTERVGAPKRNLYFGTHHKVFIKKLELLPLTKDERRADGWPVARGPVDVLKRIDPARDAIHGRWAFEGPVLVSPVGVNHGGLNLPVGVPDEYVLVIEATPAPVNAGWTFHVGLVSGPSQFVFVVDAPGGIGLDRIDGKPFTSNETSRPGGRFTPGTPVTLECTVRKGGVHVTMNGESKVDWLGERSRLSVVPIWPGRAAAGLFISTHGSYHISRIEVRPAGEEPPGRSPQP